MIRKGRICLDMLEIHGPIIGLLPGCKRLENLGIFRAFAIIFIRLHRRKPGPI